MCELQFWVHGLLDQLSESDCMFIRRRFVVSLQLFKLVVYIYFFFKSYKKQKKIVALFHFDCYWLAWVVRRIVHCVFD